MAGTENEQRIECELCIIGAGYAGLNGLNAAAKYLAAGDRVVFIDRHDTWGGQWVEQYDYVRLHQPYQRFTAGDQKWRLGKEPSHLATKREVLDHLSSVAEVSAGHLEVDGRFGYEYVGHEISDGKVHVRATPSGAEDAAKPDLKIVSARLLDAAGFDIKMLGTFEMSSSLVRSISITDPIVSSPEFLQDDKPVYVIGSGKTAMDTVLHLARQGSPHRKIHVISGRGMYFFVRDRYYPQGLARHRQGLLTGDGFLRMVRDFDGSNEQHIMREFAREGLATSVFPDPGNCRYGLMSLDEVERVKAAIEPEIRGHLVDVDGTTAIVRNGDQERRLTVSEDSWFVNCTSHLVPQRYAPVIRDSGLVCAPQNTLGFTGPSAYHVTHAWYRGGLAPIAGRLYRVGIEVEPKLRMAPLFAVAVLANTMLINEKLPLSVVTRFEGDFHKWYPLHRQIATAARLMAAKTEILDKAERLVTQRFSDSQDVSAAAE